MAKLIMPLMSAEASGKLADCLVYFTWKGINVVRQWTIPTNPRDIDQKLIRQKLACCGKFVRFTKAPQTGLLDGSTIMQLIKAQVDTGEIWNARFVSKVMQYVKTDANFTDLWSDLTNGTATSLTAWQTSATGLGFLALTDAVKFATEIPPELQLFMAAYGAYTMELSATTEIYNDYPTNWSVEKIEAFATDMYTDT